MDTMGKAEEARKLYQEAVEIAQKLLGPEHPDTHMYMRNCKAYEDAGEGDKESTAG